MKIGIVILNYNSAAHTQRLLKELETLTEEVSIVVVDNCSSGNDVKVLEKQDIVLKGRANVITNFKNQGYFKGNLAGAKHLVSNHEITHVLILNPDVGSSNWTEIITKGKERLAEGYFIVGPKVVIPGFTDVSSPVLLFSPLSEAAFNFSFPFSYLLRRSLIKKAARKSGNVFSVEGSAYFIDLDKMLFISNFFENIFLYGEEIIYGLIARQKAWSIYYDNALMVSHYHPPRQPSSSYEVFYLDSLKEICRMFEYSKMTTNILTISFLYKMSVRKLVSKLLKVRNAFRLNSIY